MTKTATFIDQMGHSITVPVPPSRIVSLVPSQTELLFDLGLDEQVVGITKYCIHPSHWRAEKTIVGGTKDFSIGLIDSLNPDLIIGNKEENFQEGISALQQRYPVWMSEIYSLEDALEMIGTIGALVDKRARSQELISEIRSGFQAIKPFSSKTVLYLIWRKPWMAAGKKTFINDMLSRIGLQNCLPNDSRYPQLTNDDLKSLQPDLVFLSSEPYPFKEKHIQEIQVLLPNAKIVLVDGEMFSWYGSRMLKARGYFGSAQG